MSEPVCNVRALEGLQFITETVKLLSPIEILGSKGEGVVFAKRITGADRVLLHVTLVDGTGSPSLEVTEYINTGNQISNSHIEKDRKKIKDDEKLSPILLVRDEKSGKVIIADGYHRMCAVYSFNEDAYIPCKIV
ncbi:MAG: hypothetical protein HIU83_08995 [Proteobacteria bacterium]|nr:hypothetical protein [Pseudomonadota bacterium]